MSFLIVVPSKDLPKEEVQLSFQFILRPSEINENIGALYHNELWMVVYHRKKKYLWCKLMIESIEELREQDLLEGYLLTGDAEASEYFYRLGQEREKLEVDGLLVSKIISIKKVVGIDKCTVLRFRKVAEKCSAIKMVPPKDDIFTDLSTTTSGIPAMLQYRAALQQQACMLKRFGNVPVW